MILRIDHIGLATGAPDALAPYLGALGMSKVDGGVAGDYRVACEFWHSGRHDGEPSIELVSPAGDGSVLDAHLARRGPGLHHIAVEVDELEAELERLRSAGFTAVDREPCAGARPGMRVAFTYLPRPAGLLVELVQYGAGQHPSSAVAAARLAARTVFAAPPEPPVNVNSAAPGTTVRSARPGGSA
jgi:methylmalonyl-CoA/ethylmalonyl-CoA epimerase